MAKLINVIKDIKEELEKRQLPLVIDEKLTMVLDLINVDFLCEYPKLSGKEKDLFLKKFSMLTSAERKTAFEVSRKRLLDIVSAIVPCVGCRRSVERLLYQMATGPGKAALYPLVVTVECNLILPEEAHKWPSVIGAMFQNYGNKLNTLSTSWNRSKKSSRCTLHSLDAQRYVRPPLGSGWKTLWDCMVPFCKEEVATIEISQLLSTLETYLQKHRFCTECRTKVMKAYSLLVDEPEEGKRSTESSRKTVCPISCEHNHGDDATNNDSCNTGTVVNEKGFVPKLYAGIRRCSPNKHIHVDQKTDYIMKLIEAAEPELLGNGRREKHAKTLEIAQEEVLVCVGLCLYERVHRIQLRLREEQTTCQLLSLVAINALSTNFEIAVEMKRGISQLELLFQEFNRADQVQQRRKQVRKLKKRRKKEERKNAATIAHTSGNIGDSTGPKDNASDDQKDEDEDEDDSEDSDDECLIDNNEDDTKSSLRTTPESLLKLAGLGSSCFCFKSRVKCEKKSPIKKRRYRMEDAIAEANIKLDPLNSYGLTTTASTSKEAELRLENLRTAQTTDVGCRRTNDNDSSDTCSFNSLSKFSFNHKPSDSDDENEDDDINSNGEHTENSSDITVEPLCNCCTAVTNPNNDCGYGSADNNTISSGSSVDSNSELACSEGFCNHEGFEYCNLDPRDGGGETDGFTAANFFDYDEREFTLVVMLNEQKTCQVYTIPLEAIRQYRSCMESINKQREELRKQLRTKFAQFCSSK